MIWESVRLVEALTYRCIRKSSDTGTDTYAVDGATSPLGQLIGYGVDAHPPQALSLCTRAASDLCTAPRRAVVARAEARRPMVVTAQGRRLASSCSRNGYDIASRSATIAAAVAALPCSSCIIDAESHGLTRARPSRLPCPALPVRPVRSAPHSRPYAPRGALSEWPQSLTARLRQRRSLDLLPERSRVAAAASGHEAAAAGRMRHAG